MLLLLPDVPWSIDHEAHAAPTESFAPPCLNIFGILNQNLPVQPESSRTWIRPHLLCIRNLKCHLVPRRPYTAGPCHGDIHDRTNDHEHAEFEDAWLHDDDLILTG